MRWRLITGVALIAIGWPPARAGAQELPTALGHYHLDVWRAQGGVRLTFVSNLVEARDGYLWLSSQSGLARFDGVRFTVFDGSNTPALRGLPSLEIYPLLEDARGALWIGSDAGLFTYQDAQVRPAAIDSAFFNTDQVNRAAVDSTGAVWAVTRSGRVLRITRDGEIRAMTGTAARWAGGGSGVTVDAVGDVWVAAGEHATYRIHHDSLRAVVFPRDMHVGAVNEVYATADSSVWFGAPSAIVRWRHGVFSRIPLPPKRAFGQVSCFAVAPDGALWIGTQGAGIYRYDGQRFTTFTQRDGLSDNRIVDILVDRSHNIWIATRDGLDRLRPVPFRVITQQNGLPAALPGAMVQDSSGAIWIAPPTGGLFRGAVDENRARFKAVDPVSHADRVNALAVGRRGAILTGWLGGSVRRVEPGATHDVTVIDGLAPVTDVLEDSERTLWIGTWSGLYRLREGRRTLMTTRDGLPDNAVQRIIRDSRGTLWVATQTGIAYGGPGDDHFVTQPAPPRSASRALTVFERPAGAVWIGSAQGLARVSGGPPTLLTSAQGLPEDWVGAVEPDDAGHLWLAQLGGLTRVDAAQVDAAADTPPRALTTSAAYEALDGMPGGDPSAWAHPWSFRDRVGALWFAMGHGIVVVDPRYVERDLRPPVMHLEQVIVDGAAVPLKRVETLGPSVRRIELRYTGVDLTNGPSVRFRYRLDGFDTAWTDVGTQRVASYTHLAPGGYRFRVQGRGSDGRWSPTVASVEIAVEPALYRREWFVVATALTLALTLWAAHRAVVRARSDAIREERSRLAREIHDSLLQGFSGIALELDAAAARLALPPAQQSLLDRVLSLTDQTLRQAREVVWDIRLPGTATVDLEAECADAARRILDQTPTAAHVESRGRQRPLDRTTQAEALRIVEEALTNVRKHADARSVAVTITYRWRWLRITIRDDGRGFDAASGLSRAGHWGLLGMRERASRIGGRLSIRTSPQTGTIVSVDIPRRAFRRPTRAVSATLRSNLDRFESASTK